jgi:hypothetical protein
MFQRDAREMSEAFRTLEKTMLMKLVYPATHLKSLHQFMDEAPHSIAVRVWSQPFSIDEVTTQKGKKFKLLNLPFYYVGILEDVLKQHPITPQKKN